MHRASTARIRLAAPVIALCLVQFVDVLGVTSVVTAIPAMLDGVGAGDSLAGPVATAYAMFFGGLLALGARLGRKYGHRRTLFAGLGLLVAASVIGALATTGWQLVAARSLQGAASAISVPAAMSLLLFSAPDTDTRSRALSLWSAAGATAGAAGFLVGGILTDLLGWTAVFWVNVPVGMLLTIGIRRWVTAEPDPDRGLALDVPGATMLTASVMAVVLGASFLERSSTRLLGLMVVAIGVSGTVLLIAWLRRAREPIIPLATLRQRRLSIGAIGSFVNTAATSSAGVLLTLYLQRQEGLSPFRVGLMLLPISLGVVAGSTAAATLTSQYSRRLVIGSGLGMIAAGDLMAALTLGSTVGIMLAMVVLGAGLGLSSVGCNDIGTDVPEEHASTAIGLLNTAAQLGSALGIAGLVLLSSLALFGGKSGTAVGLTTAAAMALLTAITLVLLIPATRPAPREVTRERGYS
jgi:MFS family permease